MTCTFGLFTLKAVLGLFVYSAIAGVCMGIAENLVKDYSAKRRERR